DKCQPIFSISATILFSLFSRTFTLILTLTTTTDIRFQARICRQLLHDRLQTVF
ncbi:hypothetical protein HK102_007040, partial [Quaeritorhiza haematococci]